MNETRALVGAALCVPALGLAVLSCGPVVPRPTPVAAAEPSSPPPAAATAPAEGAPVGRPDAAPKRHFKLGWSRQTRPFNKGVAVAATGHVAVLGSRSLSLHDGRSGAQLAVADVCFTFAGAYAFVANDTGALVCEDGVRLYSLPKLDYRGMRALPGKARVASFAPGLAAVGFASGSVRVYDTTHWEEQRAVAVDQRVTALALSLDGRRLAVGLEQGEVVVHELAGDGSRRVSVKRGFEVAALAFSPSGDQLFAAAGPLVAVWNLAKMALQRRFRTVADVTEVRWLGGGEIASVGRDGLLVLDLPEGTARSIGGGWAAGSGSPVGLATSQDAQVLCVAEREGKLACLSRGKLPATRQLLVPDEPGGPGALTMAGRVVVLTGKRLRVRALPNGDVPSPGTEVIILRYAESQIGPVRAARWLEAAKGRVWKLKKDVVYVSLAGAVKELPGVKDPLVYDAAVRLAWQPAKP